MTAIPEITMSPAERRKRERLDILLDKARQHVMTPAEVDAQRKSWVCGEMLLQYPTMTYDEASARYDAASPPPIYTVGDNTMAKVFLPAGLTNVSNIQAVLDAVERALTPPPSSLVEAENLHRCPICDEPFEPGDNCATDIEMGTCHYDCLDGSPVVDLETGEEVLDDDMHSYPYSEVMDLQPQPNVDPVRAAAEGIADDYMTSEHHHPGYVLIPAVKFEAIRSALATCGG